MTGATPTKSRIRSKGRLGLSVSLTVTPFSLLQANGRADLVAKLQFVELPVYLIALWYFAARDGMNGAAMIWTLRAGVDATLMYAAACMTLPDGVRALGRLTRILGVAVASFVLVAASPALPWRIASILAASIWFVWSLRYIVDDQDWRELRALWNRTRGGGERQSL